MGTRVVKHSRTRTSRLTWATQDDGVDDVAANTLVLVHARALVVMLVRARALVVVRARGVRVFA